MANETVQAVRQAEFNATQIEKDAIQTKEKILIEAQNNAKQLVASMTKDAKTIAEQDLADAMRKGEEIMETTKRNAEKEVLLMREMVKDKKRAAIDIVLSNVV